MEQMVDAVTARHEQAGPEPAGKRERR
jgi:hypothetical protein